MSYATWYLVFQYNTCFLKLFKFAVHTNFSKFSSFVLKLRDRISVIFFWLNKAFTHENISRSNKKYWSKSIFQLLYFVVSFQNTQILRVRERMRWKHSAIFFSNLAYTPQIFGEYAQVQKNILHCSQLIHSLTLQILFFHFTFEFSTQSGPAECWETSNL